MTRATPSVTDEAHLELTVASHRLIADRVVEVTLRSNGVDLPSWNAGAHIDVMIGEGIIRQYSLCGDPDDTQSWRIAVLREEASRGGSAFMHDELSSGATLAVRGPRNNFPVLDAAQYLFIAGGIGITPILAMVREVQRAGKPWKLLYGGRASSSMAFIDELEALASQHPDDLLLRPADQHGRLDIRGFIGAPSDGVQIYCCGPGPLLDAVQEICADWPVDALQIERFSAPADLEPMSGATFEVELASSGEVLSVGRTSQCSRCLRIMASK